MLMERGQESQGLSSGQMLLMGFDGLFTRLDDEFGTLLECVDMMQVPEVWKKVDVVREAKSLQVLLLTLSQMTHFRLFQNEKNCRRQFQIR